MKAIVIISYTSHYGWDRIIHSYNSIRKLDNNITIIIVNNYNEPCNKFFLEDPNCRYIVNPENTYELGAIQTALYSNTDIENFYIIHDSCIIQNYIPEFSDSCMFWKTTIFDIAPAVGVIKNWCEQYFPDIEYNNPDAVMCQGLMGYFSRNLLTTLFESGLKNIKVSTKHEAVASEGMMGILLKKFMPSISSYYNFKLDSYISGKVPYDSIVKLVGGKTGSIPNPHLYIFVNKSNIAHPSYQFDFFYKDKEYSSLDNCFILNPNEDKTKITFIYLQQNRPALDYLTQCSPSSIAIENDSHNLTDILRRNNHYLFCLKHFNIYEYT